MKELSQNYAFKPYNESYDTFVLKNNGQLATKERKIRIVMETGEDLSALTPSLSKYFEFSRQNFLKYMLINSNDHFRFFFPFTQMF